MLSVTFRDGLLEDAHAGGEQQGESEQKDANEPPEEVFFLGLLLFFW